MNTKHKFLPIAVAAAAFSTLVGTSSANAQSRKPEAFAASENSPNTETGRTPNVEPNSRLTESDIKALKDGIVKSRVVEKLNKTKSSLAKLPKTIDVPVSQLAPSAVERLCGKSDSDISTEDLPGKSFSIKAGEFSAISDSGKFYLKNTQRSFSEEAEVVVSKETALATAKKSLEKLGLPMLFTPKWSAHKLMARKSSKDGAHKDREVAHKVFGTSTIGGVPVMGARTVVSLFLNGGIHKISLVSPSSRIEVGDGIHKPLEMEKVMNLVQEEVSKSALSSRIEELEFRAAFSVVDGQLRRTVLVRGPLYFHSEDTGKEEIGRMGEIEVHL